ncbi:trypco2 family protein [Streptomyces rishiriensis]|uniref:trypco2 family protein n=1 Tax=Streptomyces rishiriensis TaxID=68264 RepID=UPI0033C4CAFD
MTTPHTEVPWRIQAAYDQLHAAVTEIPLRGGLDSRYESIELELNVEVDENTETQGDVKFWVVGGGAKKAQANRSTHPGSLHEVILSGFIR